MKTLGLIVVLGLSVVAMILMLLPLGITMQVREYADSGETTLGRARVGEMAVQNNGWFTQSVQLPEITACIGDQEVPLDAWISADGSVVKGSGQVERIRLRPKESGTIYLVATDSTIHERMVLYYRTQYFSCLNPGKQVE